MEKMLRHILIIISAIVVAGCNIWSDYDPDGILSELTISVTVSDTPGTPLSHSNLTRAEINPSDYLDAAHDGEMIQTLRIMILRPQTINGADTVWKVEHNRYMDLYEATSKAYMEVGGINFKVYGPEMKKVYLFVNENAVKPSPSGSGTVKLVNYDFSSLAPGDVFPQEKINGLTISLNESNEEVPSAALPMSECHTFKMPASDFRKDLFVTRAATKFTYIFDNRSNTDLELSSLTISKSSRKEYYIPRFNYTGDPLSGNYTFDNYEVPNIDNNDYYVFKKSFGESVTLPASTVKRLEQSIYLLEGKYTDPDGKTDSEGNLLNYSMSVNIGGTSEFSDYFPDVKQLPRNTHVVVVITFKDYGTEVNADWSVSVYPYGEYWLYPDFGISTNKTASEL